MKKNWLNIGQKMGCLLTALIFCNSLNAEPQALDIELKRLILTEHYEQANTQLERLALNNNSEAQYQLALHFLKGLGVNKNAQQALYWFQKSAELGNAKAQYNAAVLLLEKNPVQQQAIRYLNRAAEQGHRMAKQLLQEQHLQTAIPQTDFRRDELLRYAALHGDSRLLISSLNEQADPNSINGDGQSALLIAINNQHLEIAKLLIDYGASLGLSDSLGNNALHYAAKVNMAAVISRPYEKNAIDKKNNKGDSPLAVAVMFGQQAAVKELLKIGANAQQLSGDERQLVDVAEAKNYHEIVKLLVSYGAQRGGPEAPSIAQRLALIEQQLQEVRYKNWDALRLATWLDDQPVVTQLLSRHQTAESVGGALLLALEKAHTAIALQLSHVLSEQAIAPKILQPFLLAAVAADDHESFTILSNKADKALLNEMLWSASRDNAIRIMDYLLSHGADVNSVADDSTSPLQQAALNGHTESVTLLLAHKADINLQDLSHRSALWQAINTKQLATARLLLAAGAELDLQDNHGHSALMRAVIHDNSEGVALLLEQGASTRLTTQHDNTVLIAAAEKASAAVLSLLLVNNTTLEARNDASNTALMVAVMRGDKSVVELLLVAGADPSRRNSAGVKVIDMTRDPVIKQLLMAHR